MPCPGDARRSTDRRIMPKKHVNPSSLFPSVEHGFSQVVVAIGARTVFIAGQTAWDANKRLVGRTCGEQARQALRNVRTAVVIVCRTVPRSSASTSDCDRSFTSFI